MTRDIMGHKLQQYGYQKNRIDEHNKDKTSNLIFETIIDEKFEKN